jgi:hypothetical protein
MLASTALVRAPFPFNDKIDQAWQDDLKAF